MRRVHRLIRKLILAYAKRSSREDLLKRSERGAISAVVAAASRSTAYQTLLRECGISLGTWRARGGVLSELPVLTKENTFGRFSLTELSGPGFRPEEMADILTSSGRGGLTFGFRLSHRKVHESAWFDIDLGLQDAFAVDQKRTLLVNCLPMGVVFASKAVTVANVSVREDMACAILQSAGPHYDQTLICTDPLFAMRLLDHAERVGLDWARISASFILGEEMLVESQRDHISLRAGIDPDDTSGRLVASSFGVGELGLNLLFETRETIRIRRALRRDPELRRLLGLTDDRESTPSVFCFNPLRTFVQIHQADHLGYGELCFTMLSLQAVIPLPRYATGDVGRLLSEEEVQLIARRVGCVPWLPVILVKGRAADRGGRNRPSVEAIKDFIYGNAALARRLSGAFRIQSSAQGDIVVALQPVDRESHTQALKQALEVAAAAFDWPGPSTVSFRLTNDDDRDWSPLLDYERKFSYVHRPPEVLSAAQQAVR